MKIRIKTFHSVLSLPNDKKICTFDEDVTQWVEKNDVEIVDIKYSVSGSIISLNKHYGGISSVLIMYKNKKVKNKNKKDRKSVV